MLQPILDTIIAFLEKELTNNAPAIEATVIAQLEKLADLIKEKLGDKTK